MTDELESLTWEKAREWLKKNDWKLNVLADYSGGEIRLAISQGFQRIEVKGTSDLDVMSKAIAEVRRRKAIDTTS